MRYKIIFNGRRYYEETIRVDNWIQLLEQLDILVQRMQEPPDVIYLISIMK